MKRRLFQPVLVAGLGRDEHGRFVFTAPAVGLWRNAPDPGAALQPGMSVGDLEVLGVLHRVEVPEGAHGSVVVDARARARTPVAYGDALVALDPRAQPELMRDVAASAPATASAAQLVFRSPSSGRFYGRPGPDKPAFVGVGDVIESGHTVALLEVMKTFNRIQYGGAGLPARARVARIVPVEEADLSAGDPILELEHAD